MSFGSILYQFILSPLILILEAVYAIAFHFLHNYGAAIIPLSLVVNFLLLPFYNRADAIQAEEKDREKQMDPFITHIKKTFKGDERYMMLQTFYRENNYKPIYALRSSIALILEVPFFIAAYRFLSNLSVLRGASFLMLKDLGEPDALLRIGNFSINVLPVLMTLINIISSEIYTKGMKWKDKITLHGMALIFLVLLYQSPSGLVLYWTLNNVFSLVKNIVYAHRHLPKTDKSSSSVKDKVDSRLFLYGAGILSVFLGALIPSLVISSSTSEFILMTNVHSPVRYILYSLFTAVGALVIWGGLFYYLAGNKNRQRARIAIWCFVAISFIDFLMFGKSESILSSDLQFDTGLSHPANSVFMNGLLVLAVICVVIFIFLRKESIIRFLAPILLIVVTIISVFNIYRIQTDMKDIRRVLDNTSQELPEIPLSKTGQNVVVVMIDRAIPAYIPYMFQEKPELQEQFSGFTWYPNTLSFGMRTVIAAPALFGGYDYTPYAINERSDVSLRQKHDEALLTMPVIFSEAGYDVTVFDPPFAGYSGIPDLSIYDGYDNIKAYNTEQGMFCDSVESDKEVIATWKRNFFCYSLMKASPLCLQSFLYTDGSYFSSKRSGLSLQTFSEEGHYIVSSAYMNLFNNSYSALQALPSLTTVDDSGKNHFFLLQNSTAHNTMPLQEPEYAPQYEVDNTEFDKNHPERFTCDGITLEMETNRRYKLTHYQCNMAAWIQLGNWMDELKRLGVYDNTRIIIVSDHGWPLGHFDDRYFLDGSNSDAEYNSEDSMAYNPVLLYKDFGSSGEMKIDDSFMTSADTPYIAMNGLLENPINPFTNRPIYRPEEKAGKQYIMYTDNWALTSDSGNVFQDTIWYSLEGQDIFDMDSWQKEDEEEIF